MCPCPKIKYLQGDVSFYFQDKMFFIFMLLKHSFTKPPKPRLQHTHPMPGMVVGRMKGLWGALWVNFPAGTEVLGRRRGLPPRRSEKLPNRQLKLLVSVAPYFQADTYEMIYTPTKENFYIIQIVLDISHQRGNKAI